MGVSAATRTYVRTAAAQARDWAAQAWSRHWIAACALALILASDTKLVLKDRITGASSTLDPFIAAELLVYAGVGLLLLRRGAWRPRPGGMHPLEVLLLAFVAAVLVSAALSTVPLYSAVRAGQTVVIVLLARAAISTGTIAWFRPFAVLFLFATAALAAAGVVLPTQKGPLQQERFNWLATHPVVVGQFTALALCVGVVLTIGSRAWRGDAADLLRAGRWAAMAVATCMSGAALLATHTRGSVIAAAGGITAALLLILPAKQRITVVLAALWVGLMMAALVPSLALSWVVRDDSAENLLTLNSRTDLWSVALASTLRETPLVGFGLGAIRSLFVAETGLGGGHNAVVNIFTDLGLLGLAVWLALIIWPALIVARSGCAGIGRLDRTIWIVAYVTLLINGVTAEGLGATPSMAFIWTVLLAVVALQVDQAHMRTPASPRAIGPGTPAAPQEGNHLVTSEPRSADYPTLPQSVRAHRRLILGVALGLMLLAGAAAFLMTPRAQAEGRLGLQFPGPGNVLLPVPTGDQSLKRYAAQRALFATSDPVIERTAAATGLRAEAVRERLSVQPSESGNALDFTATDGSVAGAVALVNVAMDAYRAETLSDVTQRWEERAEGMRAAYPGDAERSLAHMRSFNDGVEFTTSAAEDRATTRGVPWRALLAGLLAGLGLAALGVWAVDVARVGRQ